MAKKKKTAKDKRRQQEDLQAKRKVAREAASGREVPKIRK